MINRARSKQDRNTGGSRHTVRRAISCIPARGFPGADEDSAARRARQVPIPIEETEP